MKIFPPSAYTPSPTPSKRSNVAGGLAAVVLSLGLVLSAGARVTQGFTDGDDRGPMATGWILDYRPGTQGFTREDDRIRGHHRAPITLLEYSDFTCGFCEKFFKETWPILFSEYVDTGKVRLVYRDFPRALSGPSVDTALAARCAGEQGQYWAMHDRLFSSSSKFSPAQLRQQAEDLRLDAKQFASCLEAAPYTQDIFQDRREAGLLGIRGTPHFILYVTDRPQEAVAIPGAFPYEVFKEEIDKLLQTASSPQASPESL